MRTIQLQYPDQTSDAKILDDLTVLSRNSGQQFRASVAFDDAEHPSLRHKLLQRGVPAVPAATIADDEAAPCNL